MVHWKDAFGVPPHVVSSTNWEKACTLLGNFDQVSSMFVSNVLGPVRQLCKRSSHAMLTYSRTVAQTCACAHAHTHAHDHACILCHQDDSTDPTQRLNLLLEAKCAVEVRPSEPFALAALGSTGCTYIYMCCSGVNRLPHNRRGRGINRLPVSLIILDCVIG